MKDTPGIDSNHDDDKIPPSLITPYDHIGCHVDFEVEMTVSDPMVVAILDKVLLQVAGHQVDAFDKRCKEMPVPHDLIEQVERE
jgi:hypothetical protein